MICLFTFNNYEILIINYATINIINKVILLFIFILKYYHSIYKKFRNTNMPDFIWQVGGIIINNY